MRRVRTIRVAAVLLAVAFLHVQAQAATRNFMWKATGPVGTVYLVGSIHLLTPEYYPLDPAFDEAFKASDLVVEELDLGEVLASSSQIEMLMRGMLPAGQSLETVLSPETLAAVLEKFAELGIPAGPLKQFKPWLLSLTLQALEMQKAGFDGDLGLDKHFYDLAKSQGRPVQGLETLAFQLSRFDEMSMPLQDRMLAESLKELETTKTSFAKLADAWKTGDVPAIESLILKDLKSEPEMYQRLLVERNRTWLPIIEALFSRPKPAFIVVGAAHLVGADGLLKMLRDRGYTIQQM